ncbi:MAG: ATP synthase subunit I [Clostridia bacterium]|nr:ATP synthase subunit I [Clostridia bacterium]
MATQQSKDTVKKEVMHIIVGVLILDVIMCLAFLVLKRFNLSVVLGAATGSVIAIINFAYLGSSVIKALNMGEKGKGYLQRTYIIRVLLNCAAVVIAAKFEQVNLVAGIVPLFMPRITIYAMQILGMYKPEE